MPFTGRLGTADSRLGNFELGQGFSPDATFAAAVATATATSEVATLQGDVTGGALFGEVAQATAVSQVAQLLSDSTLGAQVAQATAVSQVASLHVDHTLLAQVARATARAWPAKFPMKNPAVVAAMSSNPMRIG